MDLLGGYGSDGSDEEVGPKGKASTAASSSGPKTRKIDYSKLPVSRPLLIEPSRLADHQVSCDDPSEEAPLKQAAAMESARKGMGRSLLAAIPPPKVTLGKDMSIKGSVRIDLSDVIKPKDKNREPVANLLRGDKDVGNVKEHEFHSVPDNMMGHKMFNDLNIPIGGGDGPTEDEIQHMRKTKNFTKIAADDMIDPDWYMNNKILGGGTGLKGKTVSAEVSMYETKKWGQTTMANPNKVQKRKHQINWLASEAMEKEAETLDRNASGKLSKAQTSMKYGW